MGKITYFREISKKLPLRFFFLISLCTSALASRVVDRTENGIIFWSSAFTPDGLLYFYQSQIYKGFSRSESISLTNKIFIDSGLQTSDSSLYPSLVGIGTERPLYPRLMSLLPSTLEKIAPILWPTLAFIGCIFLLDQILKHKYGRNISLLILTIVSTSFYVRFNFISTTTDSLASFFILLGLFSIIKIQDNKKYYALLVSGIVLSCETRPVGLIWLIFGIFLLLTMRFKHNISFLCSLIIILLSGTFTLISATSKFGVATQYNSRGYDHLFSGYILEVIKDLPSIIVVEFSFLFVHDFLVFSLVTIALFLSIFNYSNRFEVICNLSFIISCFSLAAINGTIGVGFRYEMPIIISSSLVLGHWLRKIKLLD